MSVRALLNVEALLPLLPVGHQLSNKWKFTVSATAGGQQVEIPFNNMNVQLPILSVREVMGKESFVMIDDDTGIVSNKRIKPSINFIVRDGLWFMELNVRKPEGSQTSKSISKLPRDSLVCTSRTAWRSHEIT